MGKSVRKKLFIPLTLKLALVVGISIISALILYEGLEIVERAVAKKYYLNDDAVNRNVDSAFRDFTDFVERRHIKSTDTENLQDWIRNHDYTYLMIFDNYTISFDGGWSVNSATTDGNDVSGDQAFIDYDDEAQPRISPDSFDEDVKNRIISFADGKYYVYMNVYREQHLYRIFDILELVLCVMVVVGALLVYNANVMRRITKVSKYAESVTNGDLGSTINAAANDEVGRLAVNVDTMRASLIKRLINEKEAWDKNSELITAMSHDIRTPLTSLIGYLDIIESGKYQSQEEAMKYVSASRDKAFQLKDLSDKLFQYFLVFGSQASDKDLEVYDAGILIQQLISEHSAELINYGFNVDFRYSIPEEEDIEADVSGLKRLFDNVFSNVLKYGDRRYSIKVSGEIRDKNIVVYIMNRVRADSRNVESNKIGLKTCEKICKDMGGDFTYSDENEMFTVKITLPTYAGKASESSESSLAEINVHDIDLESLAETIESPETKEGAADITEEAADIAKVTADIAEEAADIAEEADGLEKPNGLESGVTGDSVAKEGIVEEDIKGQY